MNFKATIANSLWLGSNLPAWMRFQSALNHPAETQKQLLGDYLLKNTGSAYGKAHVFAEIKNYEEFVQRVPLNDYNDLKPWIERIIGGEKQVLTGEAVTHLIPTSGSSGARKLIPFTASLQREFNAAVGPWLIDLLRQFPGIAGGPAYWSVTPITSDAETEDSAVPIGFDADTAYLGGTRQRLASVVMAVPDELRFVKDMDVFRYVTLLCLLRQRELRLVSVWHPSFLSLLLDALPANWQDLLTDIRSGQCQYAEILPPVVRTALKLRPLPERANELSSADPRKPETLWPHLKLISCWGDGYAKFTKADLKHRFPGVFAQSKGLLATEAAMTIPFQGLHPIAVRSHFFEFLDSQGKIQLTHELEENKIYEVVVTTGGGLWRYRLQDQVQVIGFVGKTPSLRFLGRVGNISDRFGEKFSESFVVQAMQEALGESNPLPRFALLAPDEGHASCCYTLYIEGEIQDALAARLDTALQKNPQYAWCRKLGQLKLLRLFKIETSGYEVFITSRLSQGKRVGEIKPCLLSPESGWSRIFSGKYIEETASIPVRR
jgi:hypothetical protein